MQIRRNPQRLAHRTPQPRHTGRANGTPPRLGFERRGAFESDRQQAQQTVGEQAEGSVTLERWEGALATVGEAASSCQLVEDILDFEAGSLQFPQPLGGHLRIGREEDSHLVSRAPREDDHPQRALPKRRLGMSSPTYAVRVTVLP
jgi:hypothetical protein